VLPLNSYVVDGMKIGIARLGFLASFLAMGGCALGLPGYNVPFNERVLVLAESPTAYQIVIDGSKQGAVPIPPDGRVTLQFPVLPRQCSTYFLGFRIKDRSVEARDLVHFIRDGRVVKRLSVNEIRRLPADALGFHKIRLR
jgi:hypothetical protein